MGGIAAITALEHPSGAPKRVRVWLEGEPFRTTNQRVTRALRLEVGGAVCPIELTADIDEEEKRQAKDHALRYLTYRARSTAELAGRLREIGYGEEAVTETVEWLSDAGYLDDHDFADQWVAQRVQIKRYGRLRIAAELARKGFEPDEIRDALDRHCPEEGERERALALGRRRLAGARGLERLDALRKLGPYLRHRGYGSSVTAWALGRLGALSEAEDAGFEDGARSSGHLSG